MPTLTFQREVPRRDGGTTGVKEHVSTEAAMHLVVGR
jgi:hypothetical protein